MKKIIKIILHMCLLLYFDRALGLCEDNFVNSIDKQRFWGLSSFFSTSPSDLAKKLIKETYPVEKPDCLVHVQSTIELSELEKKYLQYRVENVQKVLQKSFGINEPLRLGFCCSGGGNRAMIGTLGLLKGAAKSKILDASLYIAGLSGSTWLISQLSYLAATSYKHQSLEKILDDIQNDYKKRLSDYSMININGVYGPPLLSFESTDDIFIDIAKRFAFEQQITAVNLFGALVGDYALGLMGHDRLSEKWSAITHEMASGQRPLPLCSAIFEHKTFDSNQYDWFEMSPLQCGSAELGYIPVEYLGSPFKNGMLDIDNACHEYPISFFLGTYGSAFAATIKDIYTAYMKRHKLLTILSDDALDALQRRGVFNNTFVQGFVHNIIEDVIATRHDLVYAHFPNYSYGLENSVLRYEQNLGLFDAGIDINLPVPIMLNRHERNLDIVIMYDANKGSLKILKQIANYCSKKGIKFPSITHLTDEELQSKNMVIINDPRNANYNSECATYIYMPTNTIDTSSAPYITFNFKYSSQDIDLLSNTIEDNFMQSVDEIEEIMTLVAKKRYV